MHKSLSSSNNGTSSSIDQGIQGVSIDRGIQGVYKDLSIQGVSIDRGIQGISTVYTLLYRVYLNLGINYVHLQGIKRPRYTLQNVSIDRTENNLG